MSALRRVNLIFFERALLAIAGFNTMRVFLHDLLWAEDSAAFLARINLFLTIADNHGIKPILVLFDSCWDPLPRLGPQAEPVPGVHKSRWVQARF